MWWWWWWWWWWDTEAAGMSKLSRCKAAAAMCRGSSEVDAPESLHVTRSDIKANIYFAAPPQTSQTVARVMRQLDARFNNASDINQALRWRSNLKTSTIETSWVFTAPTGNILLAEQSLEIAGRVIQHSVCFDERWWKRIYGRRLVAVEVCLHGNHNIIKMGLDILRISR